MLSIQSTLCFDLQVGRAAWRDIPAEGDAQEIIPQTPAKAGHR